MSRLLLLGFMVFVVGGVATGFSAAYDLGRANRAATAANQSAVRAAPSAPKLPDQAPLAAATPAPTAVAEPAEAAASAASLPLPQEPDRAALRDFEVDPPPFAAAGENEPQPILPQPRSPTGRLSVLLLGIDQRPDEMTDRGDPGRTDSMILASLDFDDHTVSMVSIPRDSFVVIPGHGKERVNAAYTLGELEQRGGGPELAKKTVAQVFNVPVDRYALIDIHAMERVIDALGGVWIDNPKRLLDPAYPTDDYRTITIDIPAGRQLLDGVTAVEYARTRHPDSDYGRQTRQQQVLLAIRDQALQVSVLPRLPVLVPELEKLVRTDLSAGEIGQILNFGRGLDQAHDILSLPPNPQLTPSYTGPGGAAYINLTPAYRTAVHQLVEQPRIAAEAARVTIYNAGAPIGSGSTAAEVLRKAGLVVAGVDTSAQRVSATRIEAGDGARQTAARIAELLGVTPDALVVDGDSSSIQVLLGPDATIHVG